MEDISIGSTDRSIVVYIPDPASTDGSGKTGLTHADFTVSYTRVETDNDVVVTDVTGSLSTLTNLTDAHADWGVKEVSSTVAPGLYRLDIADAVFATGAWYAVVYVMITSSAAAATPKQFRLGAASAAEIADAVWDEARAGHVSAGSFGEGVLVESLNTAAKGHVNAEVLDVLNVDTFAEPGQEAPAATTTLVKKIGYLYKFLRNKKTQTATTLSIFADDASTVDQKSTVADDGTTFTQGELATGP